MLLSRCSNHWVTIWILLMGTLTSWKPFFLARKGSSTKCIYSIIRTKREACIWLLAKKKVDCVFYAFCLKEKKKRKEKKAEKRKPSSIPFLHNGPTNDISTKGFFEEQSEPAADQCLHHYYCRDCMLSRQGREKHHKQQNDINYHCYGLYGSI